MIVHISISTQDSENLDRRSEPEVLVSALRLSSFLTEKTKAHPSWREANKIESQIQERLIRQIEQAITGRLELFDN